MRKTKSSFLTYMKIWCLLWPWHIFILFPREKVCRLTFKVIIRWDAARCLIRVGHFIVKRRSSVIGRRGCPIIRCWRSRRRKVIWLVTWRARRCLWPRIAWSFSGYLNKIHNYYFSLENFRPLWNNGLIVKYWSKYLL